MPHLPPRGGFKRINIYEQMGLGSYLGREGGRGRGKANICTVGAGFAGFARETKIMVILALAGSARVSVNFARCNATDRSRSKSKSKSEPEPGLAGCLPLLSLPPPPPSASSLAIGTGSRLLFANICAWSCLRGARIRIKLLIIPPS